MKRQKGSILVGLLWCVALLSLMVVGVLHTARMDLLVVKNQGDRIQAHYLALAGIEKAKALLYQNARDRSRNGRNHSGELYNDQQDFKDVTLGRGIYRVMRRGRQDEGGGVIYGVSDEESRLNVNAAATNELMKLDGMTQDVAAAIISWRNPGTVQIPGGAERDYYTSLQPPYLPRNAPFQTVRELLMVRGITSDNLLGKDTRQNGFFDPGEDVATNSRGNGEFDADQDSGWAGILTVDSQIANVNAGGQDRVNIQTADESTLATIHGITQPIAHAIVTYRNQNRFQSIADLLSVTPAQNQNNGQGANLAALNGGQGQGNGSGGGVIDESLLEDIGDDVTVNSDDTLPGIIDINTASIDVLACVPGIDRQLAQAIISYRQSSGYFPNIAWLLKLPEMTHQLFTQAAPFLDARSETYRIFAEGKISSTGIRQRIQMIVRVNLHEVSTVSYREDNL